MTDTPLPGYSGMPQPPDTNAAGQPSQPAPSFGLPPDTPIMPGTTDHHFDAAQTPAPSAPPEPPVDLAASFAPMPNIANLAPQPSPAPTPAPAPAPKPIPPPQIAPEPIPGIIMPQHNPPPATPQPAPAPSATPVATVPPPAPKPAPPAPQTPAAPLRTSMYDASVRGVAGASPKDYGLVGESHRTSAPPSRPVGAPQAPARPSAQDAMYQSVLGKPLEGPVIPSTRVQPRTQPEPGTPNPENNVSSAGPAATPAEAANELARRTAIRTLESDVANTVAKNQLSLSQIALAQQRRQAEEAVADIPEGKKFSWWALSGILLALLGVGIITVAYIMQTNAPEVVEEVITTQDALIPAVPETTLDVTGMGRPDVLRTLSALAGQYASRDGISLIRLTTFTERIVGEEKMSVESDVPAKDFFTQLSAHAPERLLRSLGNQTFFGVVSVGGRAVPFLVFEVSSYDSAFAGMLEWESFILADLPFLVHTPPTPVTPDPVTGTSTATSTTTGTTTAPTATSPVVVATTPTLPTFLDIVVKNRDARSVKNPDGSTRLLYAFPTPVMLLIAQNESAMSAIIEHLTTARFSR